MLSGVTGHGAELIVLLLVLAGLIALIVYGVDRYHRYLHRHP